MRIDIDKIGKIILKVLNYTVKIFSIYKFFKRGGNCDREKDGNERERHKEKDTGEKDGKDER